MTGLLYTPSKQDLYVFMYITKVVVMLCFSRSSVALSHISIQKSWHRRIPKRTYIIQNDVFKKLISLRLANKHISYQLFRGWSGDTTKSRTASLWNLWKFLRSLGLTPSGSQKFPQLPSGSSTRFHVSPSCPGIAGMKGTHSYH
jgi:hypothetical protein